ncbi:MAG: hypothetical protein ACK5HT_02820 [Draconibacterium sp.]
MSNDKIPRFEVSANYGESFYVEAFWPSAPKVEVSKKCTRQDEHKPG